MVKGHVYVENYFCQVSSRWWSTSGGEVSIGTLTQLPRNAQRDFVFQTHARRCGVVSM